MDRTEALLAVMAAGVAHPDIQRTQTRFRIALVDTWGIPAGARVLEIGCGQGDMTTVLAEAVGPDGQVIGVDIADPDYGSPVTLGESRAFLKATPLGDRIDMRYGYDVLDPGTDLPADAFDHVVFAHCAWYFTSLGHLRRTLARVRPWARRLCFAEWDLRPGSVRQLPHLLAVLVQGQIEAAGARDIGNVRTPFSRQCLLRELAATGWRITAERTVDTTGMQDADWEITAALEAVADPDGPGVPRQPGGCAAGDGVGTGQRTAAFLSGDR